MLAFIAGCLLGCWSGIVGSVIVSGWLSATGTGAERGCSTCSMLATGSEAPELGDIASESRGGLGKKADAPANSFVILSVLSGFLIDERLQQSACHRLGQILHHDYSRKYPAC